MNEPATDRGRTRPAGEGTSDDEMRQEVAEQTSSDLKVEEAFRREEGGTASDTEAAKASGSDLER